MSDDKTNPPQPGSSYGGGTSAPRTGMTGAGLTGAGFTNPPGGQRMTTAVTAGTRIMGTYEIETLISKGGMGEVYRGRNIHTGDPVAIKIVLPHLAQEEMIVALFQKEAKVLGRLNADAIVRYHVFTVDPEIGRPALIMEFVEGTSMNDRMKQGPMAPEEVLILLRRLAGGLDKAHGVGVVHRDLSPDNVILQDGMVEHAKIIDFGIAKSSMKGDATLLQGQFAGKFSFVAPEQLGSYDGEIDARTDIYSLALMMVAAAQGRVLNMGKSIVEAVRARNGVPDLTGIDPSLRPLLEHMLEPNPANRPASMAAVIQLIDHPEMIPQRATGPGASEEDDADRTRIVPASTIAAQAAAAQGSAPKGSLPKGAPKSSPPAPANEVFVGIPSNKPAPKVEEKKGGKGGMIAALAILLVAGGGAGAYFGGFIGGGDPVVVKQPEVKEPKTGQTDEEAAKAAAKAAEEAAAKKAADEAAAAKAAADEAAKKAADEAAAKAAGDEAAKKAADEAAAAAAAKAAADEAAKKAADEAAAAAAAKAAADEAAKKAADEAAANSNDPRTAQLAWLANYQAGDCVFLSPLPGTGVPLSIEGFGTSVAPFSALLKAYSDAHGAEPNIDVRIVNPPQCPVINLANELKGAKAIPVTLAIDNTSAVLKSGETVSGRVEGLAGRAVSLFLVNGGVGSATNLKPFIKKGDDGTVSFSFTVNLAKAAEPTPQLILAVVTDQPVTKLDAVPNGVTARALVPFMKNEIQKARQEPIVALRFFKVEN